MDIKANVKSITQLKDYFFLVPDYQREYVWKPDDQVDQFLIDIDNEFDPNSQMQKAYFIGSIIIVENNGKYDVIDGQQRLTTIILSLCAFRDIMRELSLDQNQKNYLAGIENLLSSFDMNTGETRLRLELQYEESKDFLTDLITDREYTEELTPSIIKMQQAYDKLKMHFAIYSRESIEALINYARFFLTKIELVVIESENLSSALKIFETINQRGASLNAMDLVKNLLFSEANPADFQVIKDTWKEINSNLQACREANSPLRFLRYFLMARYHNGVMREDDIYKWIISQEGKEATKYETQPVSFAKELKKISKRYSDLVLATEFIKDGSQYPNTTNIGFVNKYRSRQHLVLLLALDSTVGNPELEYLAEQIESFFFFSNTIGIQAKNNEHMFTTWVLQLRGLKTIDEIKGVIELTMIPYIRERLIAFRSEFMNIHHYSYNPLYRQRYILGKIENTIQQKAGLPLKGHNFFETLQVEHILPQTPKDGIIPIEFEDINEYKNFVYKLGNVTLIESQINQAVNNFNDMQSDWFNQKQREYSNSDVLATNLLNHNYQIGQNTGLNRFKNEYEYSFDEWTKQSIIDRQKIMMDLAFDTWRFNGNRIDN